MLNNFLKTNAGKKIIIFEDKGYRLTNIQSDLTIAQELFLYYGWEWLENEREKQRKKQEQKAKAKHRR
jgi:hypothetical protein